MAVDRFPIDKLRQQNAPLDKLLNALDPNGDVVRLVGGAVRDHLLGRAYNEVDLATRHLPEDTTRLIKAAGFRAVPVGIEFGTVVAVVDGHPFEITTLRADVETDGRHARVAFTDDWQVDALRRDLTINALSVDMDGVIHDYAEGAADIASRTLRLIGTPIDRLHEDYLRLLRVFRFASQLGPGFSIDDATLTACTQAQGGLKQLSGERVWMELQKLLVGPNAVDIVAQMDARKIWHALCGLNANCEWFSQLRQFEGAVDIAPDPIRALVSLVGGTESARLLSALNAATKERDRAHAVAELLRPGQALNDRRVLRQIWKTGVDPVIDVALLSQSRELLARADRLRDKDFPVQGRDVLARGVKPGPEVGAILSALEDWWFDEEMPTRDDCLRKLDDMLA